MYSSVFHLYSRIHSSLGEINLIMKSVCKMIFTDDFTRQMTESERVRMDF